MQFTELEGKTIKIAARSITAKNIGGKTSGVVTGLVKYTDAPTRISAPFFKKIKECGIWGTRFIDNLFFDGDKLVYVHDLKHRQDAERYQDIEILFNDLNKLANEADAIRCRILPIASVVNCIVER